MKIFFIISPKEILKNFLHNINDCGKEGITGMSNE